MAEPPCTPPRARRSIVQSLVVILLAAATLLGWPAVASAHTDFESSTPSDGAVVDGPLDQVVVNFTNPAEPANEGFELLDPSGRIVTPTSIDETDGTSFVLSFEPPLATGTYGFRWQVRAGDAHPIDGSFRFEVTAPTTTTTAPASTNPTDTAASTTASTVPPPATPETEEVDPDASLAAFLDDTGPDDDASAVGRVGRTFTFLGLIFGLGSLAALVWVIRGRRDELLTQLTWIRLAGIVVATGGFIELVAAETSDGLLELLGTKPGIAATTKIIGGLAVFVGLHPMAGRITAAPRALSAAVATDLSPRTDRARADLDDATGSGHRWEPTTTAWLGLAGFVLVLVSFWFDGHTVSKGPWLVHAAVNSVHLGAAAVWGGGVIAMTTIAWMRRRATEQTDLAAMVVRFSTPATASLVAVIVAGLVMAVMILDRPADLFGTEWGRLLLAKTAAVAMAAGLGGYNHFRLRPALERAPGDATLTRELRRTLTVESTLFVAIVVLTAWLVAAAM